MIPGGEHERGHEGLIRQFDEQYDAEREPERSKEVDQSTLTSCPVAALAVSGKELLLRTLGSHPVTRARPRLAFLGPAGTFAHAALRTLPIAAGADLLPCTTVTLAIDAVRAGKVDGALVPLENSVEGAVPATLDELAGGAPLVIAEETYLPVVFDLLARPGTELADVRTVATHPHAEAQVRRWLLDEPARPSRCRSSARPPAAAQAGGDRRVRRGGRAAGRRRAVRARHVWPTTSPTTAGR